MFKPTHQSAFSTPFSPSLALAISPSDILDVHRLIAGDLRMEADDDKGQGGDDGKDKPNPDDGKGKETEDKPLGPAGERALNAERDARQKAEKDLKDLKGQMDGFFGGLKKALGVDDDKDGSDPTEVVSALQQRLNTLEATNEVERLARVNGITEEADIALLQSITDSEQRKTLAERLKPKGDEAGDDKGKGKGRSPRADASQGKGGDGSAARPTSVSQVIADRRAARDDKAKQ